MRRLKKSKTTQQAEMTAGGGGLTRMADAK